MGRGRGRFGRAVDHRRDPPLTFRVEIVEVLDARAGRVVVSDPLRTRASSFRPAPPGARVRWSPRSTPSIRIGIPSPGASGLAMPDVTSAAWPSRGRTRRPPPGSSRRLDAWRRQTYLDRARPWRAIAGRRHQRPARCPMAVERRTGASGYRTGQRLPRAADLCTGRSTDHCLDRWRGCSWFRLDRRAGGASGLPRSCCRRPPRSGQPR